MFTLEMGLIDKQSMIYLILQMCTCAYTYMCKNFQFVQTFVHVSSICWSRFEARDDQIACVYLVSSRCLILFVFTCLDVRISKIPLYTHMESHVYSRCFFQYVLFWPIWWAYFSNGLNHQLVFPYTNRKRYLSRGEFNLRSPHAGMDIKQPLLCTAALTLSKDRSVAWGQRLLVGGSFFLVGRTSPPGN